MLYQGIISGGSSPVEPVDLSPVLLWTNSSPTTEFITQTVDLDLTEYAGVIVEFYHGDSQQYVSSRVYAKKTDNFSNKFGGGFVVDTAYAKNILALNDEGIQFDNTNPNNTACIPYKIYGVKEYVVEPVGQLKNVTEVYDLSVSGNGTTKTFTATKKSSYFVFGPGYSTERVTLTTTGEILFNVSQGWFIINLNMGDTITCKSVSEGSYTCNVYLLE